MNTRRNLATGLTLQEACAKLVENELVNAWREKRDEMNAFESRAIAEYGSPSGEYSLYDTDGYRRRRQNHPLKSHEYLLIEEAAIAAGKALMGQFHSGLAECRVLGREGSPTAPPKEIPASLLPALDRNS